MIRVALDAMGGDHAPEIPVAGAVEALNLLPETSEILLIGRQDDVETALASHDVSAGRIRIIDYKSGNVGVQAKSVAKKFVNVDKKGEWSPADLQLLTYWVIADQADTDFGPVAETALCGLKPEGDKPPRFPTVIWDDTPIVGKDPTRFSLTPEQRDAARTVFDGTVAAIVEGRFPAKPRTPSQCGNCRARLMCTRADTTTESATEATGTWD